MNDELKVERKHHPFSPSSLACREACPEYEPSHSDTEAAQMGSRQHSMADSGEDDASIPDYRAMAVVECMKFVEERMPLYPGGRLIKEEYLPIDDEVIEAGEDKFVGTTGGYLDVGIISADETTAEVIDFKFGKVEVIDAAENPQGLAYLLGLVKRYPKIRRGLIWFCMPHRDQVSGAEILFDQFDSIRLRIKTIVHRAQEARKEPNFRFASPTVGTCLFCSRIGKCPKVAELALKVGHKYAPLEIPESVSTTVFTDPAQIGKGLKIAQTLKIWAEAYRAQATAKTVDDPDFVPENYDLVTSSKRSVKNARKLAELAKNFLPEDLKDRVEDLYDISLTPLEKLISTAAPRGQKEKTVEAFSAESISKGFVEEGEPFSFLRQSNKKQQPKTTKE